MAALRNKRKLAGVSREIQESARNSQSQNTFIPGMTKKYITLVSEIEGRVTKKLSQEFSRTESQRNSSEPASRDMLRNRSGNIPEQWFRKPGPPRDRSQNDPYPEVELSTWRTSNSAVSDQEETSHNC